MKKLLTFVIIAAVIGVLIFAFIEGRKEAALEAERERPVKAPTRVEVVEDENVIKLDAEALKKSGIVVAPLEANTHRPETRVYGTVLDLPELLDLRNSSAAADAQAKKTQSALDVARKEYERQKSLRDNNQNVSEKHSKRRKARSTPRRQTPMRRRWRSTLLQQPHGSAGARCSRNRSARGRPNLRGCARRKICFCKLPPR